jgi:hypothetical protein
MMVTAASINAILLNDVGGTFTNNTIVGASGSTPTNAHGVSINEVGSIINNISGINSHSNGGIGIQTGGSTSSTISNCTIYRNNNGFQFTTDGSSNLILQNFTSFGNTSNILTGNTTGGGGNSLFTNLYTNGDTGFSSTNGILASSGSTNAEVIFENCTLSVASGFKTAETNSVNNQTPSYSTYTFRNCSLGAATQVANLANMGTGGYVRAARLGGTAGNHKTWTKYGTIAVDTTITGFGGHSIRLTPNNAANKLTLDGASRNAYGSYEVPVRNGQTISINVRCRKSVTGDGANYNGNQPRLIVRKSVSLGIASDTVLATAAAANGTAETLKGTTVAVTDDGVLSFIVDCDGTTGWVNVGNWLTPSGGIDCRNVQNWYDGTPFTLYGSTGTVML